MNNGGGAVRQTVNNYSTLSPLSSAGVGGGASDVVESECLEHYEHNLGVYKGKSPCV